MARKQVKAISETVSPNPEVEVVEETLPKKRKKKQIDLH